MSTSIVAVREERTVRIGEIGIAMERGVLKTLLGSCLGVIIFDRQNRIGGLAHVVLPHAHGNGQQPGKYVDTAIPEVVRLIAQSGGNIASLNAKLTGGADMFASAKPDSIGRQNLSAARTILSSMNIPILGEHCGGVQGRRITFQVEHQKVLIEIVGQERIEF